MSNSTDTHENPSGLTLVLDGLRSVYISYAPDLAVPGATDSIQHFVDKAVAKGVTRLVLLSGRGEEEAQACQIYEVTVPRLLTFSELAEEITEAAGRGVQFERIPCVWQSENAEAVA